VSAVQQTKTKVIQLADQPVGGYDLGKRSIQNLSGVIMATLQEQLTAIDGDATTVNKQIKGLRTLLTSGGKLTVEQSDAFDKLLVAGQGIAAKTKNALHADATAAAATHEADPETHTAEKKQRHH